MAEVGRRSPTLSRVRYACHLKFPLSHIRRSPGSRLHPQSYGLRSSVSTISPRLFSSALSSSRVGTDEGARSSHWTLAASAAAFGGSSLAASIALCDEQESSGHFKRRVTRKGIRDPMTSYEVYAQKQQVSIEPENEGGGTAKLAKTSQIQATSSAVDISPMAGLETPMTAAERDLEEATRKAKQHSGGLKLFSGNGNMSLAIDIARHLGVNLGKATVGRFADGEVNVMIHENVRGKDVYVIQPTSPPVNDNMMELLLMVSTLRRASARRITVVIPYYGYARQDRKMQVRERLRVLRCMNPCNVSPFFPDRGPSHGLFVSRPAYLSQQPMLPV
jgi:N-terminal domain of ribose phosphate pyrophosphokinase